MNKGGARANPRLLRNRGGCGDGGKGEAQAGCFPMEMTDLPLAELLFIFLGAHLLVFHFVL